MDTWQKIKKHLSKQGEKCIIIEDGQPSYLVVKLEEREGGQTMNSPDSEIEKVNTAINEWKAKENQQAVIGNFPLPKEEEIKVENLPF